MIHRAVSNTLSELKELAVLPLWEARQQATELQRQEGKLKGNGPGNECLRSGSVGSSDFLMPRYSTCGLKPPTTQANALLT